MRALMALLGLAALCACQPAACTHRQLPPELTPSNQQPQPQLQIWGAAVTDPDAIFEEVNGMPEMSLLQSKTQLTVPALQPQALPVVFAASDAALASAAASVEELSGKADSDFLLRVFQRDCEEWLSPAKLLGSSRFSRRRLALLSPEQRSDVCMRVLGRPPQVAPEALDCDLTGALASDERIVYFVRHAEGWHNLLQDFSLNDPSLTPHGEQQARDLVNNLGLVRALSGNSSQRAQIVMVSPLSGALFTAVLGLNASLPPDKVPWHIDPDIVETSDMPCDTPLKEAGVEALRTLRRLDLMPEHREVPTACFEKTGRYASTDEAVKARFRSFTERLLQGEARRIVAVTHAHLLRIVMANETGQDPIWALAEVRAYALSQQGSYRPLACGS